MTKRLLTFLSAVAVVAMLTPLSIPVQASEMNCRIPFSFVVNDKTLPPGLYTFSVHDGILMVRGRSDGAVVMINPVDSRATAELKAVFERTGDRYELREAWLGTGIGSVLPGVKRHGERDKLASNVPVERIVIRGM